MRRMNSLNTLIPTRVICLCLVAILWAEPVLARELNVPEPSPSKVEPAPLTPPPLPENQPSPGYSTPTQTVPDPYQPAVRSRPRRKVGLLIGGAATLVASYAISVSVALNLLAQSSRCANCDTAGPALLIPIAGPWVALPYANPATGGQVISAILGVAQAVGLGLTIGGVVVFMNSGHPAPATDDYSMSFSPLPGGAVAAFGGRF